MKKALLIISLVCITAFAAQAATFKLKGNQTPQVTGAPVLTTGGGNMSTKTCKNPCTLAGACGSNANCVAKTDESGNYTGVIRCSCKQGFASTNGKNCI